MVRVTLEGLWIISDRIVDFRFFVKFHRSGLAIFFSVWSTMEHVSYAWKKLLRKKNTSLTLCIVIWNGLRIISDRIVDFRFVIKFHRSGPAIIFRFWNITEDLNYASKQLLIKQRTSSTWWVLLWKYYGWFMIELSIFEFLSSFTGPDLQKFSILNYNGAC